jgi:hypothetical protein
MDDGQFILPVGKLGLSSYLRANQSRHPRIASIFRLVVKLTDAGFIQRAAILAFPQQFHFCDGG